MNVFALMCYQETANVSTACGGLSTGNYYWNGTWGTPPPAAPNDGGVGYVFDGNWDNVYGRTEVNSFGTIYINYTKPSYAQNTSLWQLKMGAYKNMTNNSIGACFNENTILFKIHSSITYINTTFSEGNASCWNGSDWKKIFSNGGNDVVSYADIFEEAMWWDIVSPENKTAKKDTYITSRYNNTNYGTSSNIYVYNSYLIGGLSYNTTALINFDISAYEGKTITSAVLWLDWNVITSGLNYNLSIYEFDSDFSETTATWGNTNRNNTGKLLNYSDGVINSIAGYDMHFNVTGFSTNKNNVTFIINSSNTHTLNRDWSIRSKEASSTLAPRLEIYYSNFDSTPCNILFSAVNPLEYTNDFYAFTDCTSAFHMYRNGTAISNNSLQSLGAGAYNFTVYRDDYENYTYINDTEVFIINKIDPSLTLEMLNPLTSVYGTLENIYGYSGDLVPPVVALYKNGTLVDNPYNVTLAVGAYNFSLVSTANANFTAAMNEITYIVTQNTSEVYITLDGQHNTISVDQGQFVNISAIRRVGEAQLEVYRNGSLFNNGSSPLYNYTQFNTTSSFNFSVIHKDTHNFTASMDSLTLTITNIAPTFVQSLNAQSLRHNNDLNMKVNCSDFQDSITYSVNDTRVSINAGTGLITDNPTQNENGTYEIEVTCSDGILETSETFWYTIINSAPTVASATISPDPAVDGNDLTCLNGTAADLDADGITLVYEWYNSTIATGINNRVLLEANTTENDEWQCKITPNDGWAYGTTVSSQTVKIGGTVSAPSINWTNMTTTTTKIVSDATNPTNNNSWVNMSVSFWDIQVDDTHSVYFTKTGNISDPNDYYCTVGAPGWCYQEFANVSTTCGGLSSGNYSYNTDMGVSSFPAALDGVWDIASYANIVCSSCTSRGEIYFNYTIPSGALVSSLWQVQLGQKTGGSYVTKQNYSLPASCFTTILQLKYEVSHVHPAPSYHDYFYNLSCYNSTAWQHVLSSEVQNTLFDLGFYEEAMWWNISVPNGTNTVSCRYNTSGLTEQTYDVYTTVVDNSSQISATNVNTFSVNYPPTKPSVLAPLDGAYLPATSVLISLLATDPDSDAVNYSVWNGTGGGFSQLYSNVSSSYLWSDLADGLHYLRSYSIDQHNYYLMDNVTINVTIDTVKPLINYTQYTEANLSYKSANYAILSVNKNDLNYDNTSYYIVHSNGTRANYSLNENIKEYCYQETANTSHPNDGNCGLIYDGKYKSTGPSNNSYFDGDYQSYSELDTVSNEIFINYTKPSLVSYGSKWQLKTNITTFSSNVSIRNFTIPSSCINTSLDVVAFIFGADLFGAYVYCWNGTPGTYSVLDATNFGMVSEIDLFLSGSLYEESILWNRSYTTFFNLQDDTYSFYATATDKAGNQNTTDVRYVTIDTTDPSVTFTSSSYANGVYRSQNSIRTDVDIIEENFKNLTYFLYNASGLVNATNSTNVNWTSLGNGVYYYNATVYDLAENYNFSETRNITLDATNPVLTVNSPGDGTHYQAYSVSVSLTTTDTNLYLCNYTLYDGSDKVNQGVLNCNDATNVGVPNFGVHLLNVYAYDLAGNWVEKNINFITEEAGSSTDPGVGGSSGDNEQPVINTTEILQNATICGNGLCQQTESPLSCPIDCPINIDQLFCWFGNKECPAWVFNMIIWIIFGTVIVVTYRNGMKLR